MKKYNRALDYTVLALNELRNGKPVLAARLLASAVNEPDVGRAIAILEASNKQAFQQAVEVTAKKRLEAKKCIKANDEFPFQDGEGEGELAADLGEDFESDPLDEVTEVVDEADEVDAADGDDTEVDDDDDDDEDDDVEDAAPVTAAKKQTAAETMAQVLAKMQRQVSR